MKATKSSKKSLTACRAVQSKKLPKLAKKTSKKVQAKLLQKSVKKAVKKPIQKEVVKNIKKNVKVTKSVKSKEIMKPVRAVKVKKGQKIVSAKKTVQKPQLDKVKSSVKKNAPKVAINKDKKRPKKMIEKLLRSNSLKKDVVVKNNPQTSITVNRGKKTPEQPAHLQPPTKEMLTLFKKMAKDKKQTQKIKEKRTKTSNFISKPNKKWKEYNLDLRIHQPIVDSYFFSTFKDTYTAIVRLAKAKGLNAIAITDLYDLSCLDELKQIAEKEQIRIFPGFEFSCGLGACNDLQFIALFNEDTSAGEMNKIFSSLGVGNTLASKINLKIALPLDEIITTIEGYNGILIPTHIDKNPLRLDAVRVLIDKFGFHVFDLLHSEDLHYFRKNWPSGEFTFLTFSNSNSLSQVGSRISSVRLPSEGFYGFKDVVNRRVTSATETDFSHFS